MSDLALIMNSSCHSLSDHPSLVTPHQTSSKSTTLRSSKSGYVKVIKAKIDKKELTKVLLMSKKQYHLKEAFALNKTIKPKTFRRIPTNLIPLLKAEKKYDSLRGYETSKSNFSKMLFNPMIELSRKKASLESFLMLYSNPKFIDALFRSKNL